VKSLKGQLKEIQGKLGETEGKVATVEQLAKQLEEANGMLASYQRAETLETELAAAVAAAKDVTVDVGKAREFLKMAKGDDAKVLAGKAVELFGVAAKPEDKKRVVSGAPNGGGQKIENPERLTAAQLGQLKRDDPVAFAAVLEARREKIPFFRK